MLPADKLWPINSDWDYHAGGGQFKNINVFTEALDKRYGPSKSAEEYARKAQVMAYEGHRAMFEAYGRNKYTSTGVIQWMLNNAWPGMIWHLYDWYLRPGGSYFGAKKACEPLHVQYSYDDRSIVVVNSYYQPFANMKVVATAYNLDMSAEVLARGEDGRRARQQHARLHAARDRRAQRHVVPQPETGRPVRRCGQRELLLVLHHARRRWSGTRATGTPRPPRRSPITPRSNRCRP